MVPEHSKGITEGLEVINYVVSCVLKSNFFRSKTCSSTFAAACNKKTGRYIYIYIYIYTRSSN